MSPKTHYRHPPPRWVWFNGLLLLGVAGAAIIPGIYFTKHKPDHQQPVALAGDMRTQRTDGQPTPVGVGEGGGGGSKGRGAGTGANIVRNVSLAHSIGWRRWMEAVITPAPVSRYMNANGNVARDVGEGGMLGKRDGVRSVREEEEQPCPTEIATVPV